MAAQQLSGASILVVEDEPLIALDVCEILTEAGARVIGPASSVAAAQALCARVEIGAAVLDVRLGRELAFPFAAWLAERNIPFLFHTGETNGRELCAGWPGREVLSKPAKRTTLIVTLAKLLR